MSQPALCCGTGPIPGYSGKAALEWETLEVYLGSVFGLAKCTGWALSEICPHAKIFKGFCIRQI